MQVEMEHNPFQGSLQILVNGQPRNRLSGYSNKPFSVWYRDVFALLDGETNEPYTLILTAGNAEAKMIQEMSRLSKYCKSVTVKAFSMIIPFEKRISYLNGLSKQNVGIRFCILPSLKSKASELQINTLLRKPIFQNRLWSMQSDFCTVDQVSNNPNDCEYLLILASSKSEINLALLSSARRGYYSNIICVIIDESSDLEIVGNNLMLHYKYSRWEQSIEELLQSTVIGDCFWNAYQRASESDKYSDAFEVKERPRISIPSYIELDNEEKIDVQVSSGYPPDIEIAVRNPSLIAISGHYLKGIKPGTTNVQVFEKGTYRLLASADVEVRFVSKIRELFARDIGLRHGDVLELEQHESKSIEFEYAPDDAVDASNVRWISSDTSVARVHSLSGRVTGMNPGKCQIKCSVDNGKCVGFSINLEVVPIPSQVELPEIYRNEIVLNEGEKYRFNPVVIPPNARYEGFSIHVSNPNIAHVVDALTIEALKEGETTIVIMESPHNTCITITLKVIAVQNAKRSKKGLLSKFFKSQI